MLTMFSDLSFLPEPSAAATGFAIGPGGRYRSTPRTPWPAGPA